MLISLLMEKTISYSFFENRSRKKSFLSINVFNKNTFVLKVKWCSFLFDFIRRYYYYYQLFELFADFQILFALLFFQFRAWRNVERDMDLTNKKCGVSLAGKNSLQNYVKLRQGCQVFDKHWYDDVFLDL